MRAGWWIVGLALWAACGSSAPREPVVAEPPAPAEAASPAAPAPVDPLVAELNLDFETVESDRPVGWYTTGAGYTVVLDAEQPQSGERSLRIGLDQNGQFGMASSQFPVERARGKRLKLTGYLRTADISRGHAGLWMRVDGPEGKPLAFDNMGDRGVTGTSEWTRYEIVLPVPEDAVGVVFGALHTGDGTVWVDTLRFEVLDDAPVALAGQVVGAHSKPVADALVAVVPAYGFEPAALGRSDASGRFSLTASAGRYAITATAPGRPAAYLETRAYESGEEALRVVLEGDAVTHTGTLIDDQGTPMADTLVGIYRISEVTGDVWYTRTGDDGSFTITLLLADEYRAFVVADNAHAEHVAIDGRAAQKVEVTAIRLRPAPDAVVEAIAAGAVKLTAAEAGNGTADLEPLAKLVGKARVVGLGEATHGTREFFQLKHRMLEYLVEEHGFTVFAIEANFSEALAVNEYIHHGTGDPREALAGLYFWTWNTEEVLELIEWMRRYNADPQHRRKLSFYGFDMQYGGVAAAKLLEYFQAVDPDHAASVGPRLTEMQREAYLKEQATELADDIAGFEARLDDRRAAYVKKSGLRAWQLARQHARVLAQQRRVHVSSTGGFEERDQAMAANIQWILDVEPRGTRVVAWAHNGHVSRSGFSGVKSMGVHLSDSLGKDYVVFGFAFNRGGFQARSGTRHALTAIEVGPAPPDTIGATFARAGCSICVLDLRRLSKPAAAWLGQPRRMREIGALYVSEAAMLTTVELPERYDALIFVDQTTRARPVEGASSERE
jgi:erythromycin esterase